MISQIKRRVLEEGREIREQMWLERPSGKMFLDVTFAPVHDKNGRVIGVGSTTVDLTRMKAAEMELQASERKYRSLFENLQESVSLHEVIVDAADQIVDLKVIDANPPALKQFGMASSDELGGRRLSELITPETWVFAMNAVRSAIQVQMPVMEQYHLQQGDRDYLTTTIPIGTTHIINTSVEITETKRTQRTLQQERDRLSSLINSINDEVWFADTNRNFTLVNRSVAQSFGLKGEGEIGVREIASKLEIFRPDGSKRTIDEAPSLRALNGEVIKDEEEWIRIPLTGKINLRQVNAAPVWDANGGIIGSVAVVRDITERRRNEAATQETQKKFELLFSSSNEGIALHEMIYGEDGRAKDYRILDVNPAFEKMTNIPDKIAIGALASALYGTGTAPYLEEYENVVRSGDPCYFEVFFPPLNKQFRISAFTPKKDQFATVFMDITALKILESQLEQRADELARSNLELQQFAYVSSHDLQEPLRMVIANLSQLERKYKNTLDPRAKEYVDRAIDGGTRMRALIDDLLEYSRVDTKSKQTAPVDMNKVTSNVLTLLAGSIKESRAEILVGALPIIPGLESQMTQVMQNLLSNAIKFHGEENPRIHVSARAGDEGWIFSVQDNGIGFNMDHADRIFDMFQRLHTRDKYPGNGVGLAIVKKIIERHGGRIWVESVEGKGTTFFFTTPEEV